MTGRPALVSLLDVDDTLFDNDSLERELREHLTRTWGAAGCDQFWKIFEQLRERSGYADFLGAVEQFRIAHGTDQRALKLSSLLLDFQFASYLYPGALETIGHLRRLGTTVIVSDGDAVYQPHKIKASGLAAAAHGHVLIYVHKTEQLAEIERRFPAEHYLVVDDKLTILDTFKRAWVDRVTTVHPLQGHYARHVLPSADLPAADLTIKHIAELIEYDRDALLAAARGNRETGRPGD